MLELVNEDDIRIKGSTPDDYFKGRKCCKCGLHILRIQENLFG